MKKEMRNSVKNNSVFNANKRPEKRDLLNRRKGGQQTPTPSKPGSKPGWSLGHRLALIILLIMLGFFMYKQMNTKTAEYAKVSYTDFNRMVNENLLTEAQIRNGMFLGKFKAPQEIVKDGKRATYKGIEVQVGDYDQDFLQRLVAQGIDIKIEPERTWMNILISTLPWILIFGIWLFFLRQMQGGPKGVFSFGKSKAKLMTENQPKLTFDDVAGVEEAKQELEEIIEFLKDPRKFQRLGGKIPKGALLVGPPGTGKTLLARAVAGEAEVPFFSMSGSDFVEMFVGVGASRVRDMFEQGKSNAPCILFIDEIDAVGRQRGAGIGGGHDEREQTLNQLLVEMDGFESNDGVILLAATNRPDVLDPALLRPGRFDRQIIVDWPDVLAREKILAVHAKNIQVSSNIDLVSIAKGTPGMTGADLANVVNEAALLAARTNKNQVTMADFEEAKDKVMMGAERKSMVIHEDEKKLTAYHEAGHVLVAKYIENADPVHKVSIIARGRALGLTHFLPTDEKHNWSYNYCISKLAVLLGGRAAEQFIFNDVTNGASNDIETATTLAHKMVCEWGMSKRLGPLAFGKKDSEVFLGRDIATQKNYSEETALVIDQEIRHYVETAAQQAESIIREHGDKLEALTLELLKREVLAGPEIDRVLSGKSARRPSQRRRRRPSSRRQAPTTSTAAQTDNVDAVATVAPTETQTEEKKPARKRPPRRRKPRAAKPADSSGAADNKEAKKTPDKNDAKTPDTKVQDNQKAPEKKDDSGGSKKKKSSSSPKKSTRTRLIRLKTGGRQRVIRKAPAKKIRKIN